jgi:hypothetical protein
MTKIFFAGLFLEFMLCLFSAGAPFAYAADNAQFSFQSVPVGTPPTMNARQSYNVSIAMKNIGTTYWSVFSGYRLGSQNPADNANWGLNSVDIPGLIITPGQTVTFSFTVKAPSTPGVYNFQWQMAQSSVFFGDKTPNISITVISPGTVSGTVKKGSGEGISGVTINLCNGTAITDSNGFWTKTLSVGASYCARIASGLPAGYTSIKGTSNNSCHTNAASYEWQVAGASKFVSCSGTNEASWDLSSDSNINFTVDYPACTPNCAGKTCGPDGCGGSCGNCAPSTTCDSNGQCVSSCVPKACASLGYSCGSASDGCGGTLNCGSCQPGYSCSSGQCVAGCVPTTCAAANYLCGTITDGCGGTLNCGSCASGQTCSSGRCVAACSPSCSGKVCGTDGCGGSCGTCASGLVCSSGQCVATTNCVSHKLKKCDAGNIYWFDSCGNRQEAFQNCGANSSTANYRCLGNLLQHEAIVRDCINDVCVEQSMWDNIQDCAKTGKVCKESVCVANDTQAPAVTKPAPSGTVYASSATLSVNTNENAACRYSSNNTDFDAMTQTMDTPDGLRHAANEKLTSYGKYTYYVRCRDNSGNTNAIPAVISFKYASSEPEVYVPPVSSDQTPPLMSNLSPSGNVTTATVTLGVATNEPATCKFDTADADYDSMSNSMQGSGTLNHSAEATPSSEGSNTYYVRCVDSSGNKNKVSAKITFKYALPKPGPVISEAQPAGTVYQENVVLMVSTDKPAQCRYSATDGDFDTMTELFESTDGQIHQSMVTLADYKEYSYYVRCTDNDGNKDTVSAVIGFEYKNPDAVPAKNELTGDQNRAAGQPAATCEGITASPGDGSCDSSQDCVCDPDCGAGGNPADPDCENFAASSKNNGIWLVLGLIILVVVIFAVAVIFWMKKRGAGSEEEEEYF